MYVCMWNAQLTSVRYCAVPSLSPSPSHQSAPMLGALVQTFTALRSLHLTDCVSVCDDTLAPLALPPRALHTLSIAGCRAVSDAGAAHVARLGSALTSLDLSRCGELTDAGLSCIAAACTQLRVLRASGCNLLTDVGVRAVAADCHELRTLSLCDLHCIAAIESLCSGCPALVSVDLYNASHVRDAAVQSLARLPCLARLNLQRCRRVTDDTLLALEAHAPSLRELVVGFNKISEPGLEQLRRARPALRVVKQGHEHRELAAA